MRALHAEDSARLILVDNPARFYDFS